MSRAALVVAVALCACGPPYLVEHPPPGTIDSIAWMRGAWRARVAGRVIDEVWARTSQTTWMGLRRHTEAGRTVDHALLRMEVRERGVRYVSAPREGPRTAFAMTSATTSSARFEHPGHPRAARIEYRRSGRRLTASFEAGDGPAEPWVFERTGDAPALLERSARVCREGSSLRVELDGCGCGGELFCAGFEGEDGADAHVALLGASCDACAEASGRCELPDAHVSRLNARPLRGGARCVESTVSLLTLIDL